jgi:hypothetical protein
VKAVLYAYPFLDTVSEDYQIHIRNKAVLSHRQSLPAEVVAERIVEVIFEKRCLEWLKEKVEVVLNKLSDLDKALVRMRYFRKSRKEKLPEGGQGVWSERKYFRMQDKLYSKLKSLFVGVGFTEEVFDEHFANREIFRKIGKFLESGE